MVRSHHKNFRGIATKPTTTPATRLSKMHATKLIRMHATRLIRMHVTKPTRTRTTRLRRRHATRLRRMHMTKPTRRRRMHVTKPTRTHTTRRRRMHATRLRRTHARRLRRNLMGKGDASAKQMLLRLIMSTPTSLPRRSPRRAGAGHQRLSLRWHPMLLLALDAVFVLGKEKTQIIISWLVGSTRVNSGLVCHYQFIIFQDY